MTSARTSRAATCASCRRSRSTRRRHATSTTRSRPRRWRAARPASGCTSPTWPRYVKPGGAVDREAFRRANSVYVPGLVEPMLPEALSNRACSLVPGEDRLTVTVELEFEGAKVRRTAFHRSVIRSDARLDYPRVDRIFAGAERAEAPWAEPLAAARRVSAALQAAREARGAIAVESVEPEFAFSRDGHVTSLDPSEQTESHRLIEHLMIAANEAVARLLRVAQAAGAVPRPRAPGSAADRAPASRSWTRSDVPTPALPRHMTPQQAGDIAAEASHLRRRRGAPPRPRPDRPHLARAALAQAGALLAAQPRALRPALVALLPLHVADPALPGPDLPPRAAERDRRRRGGRAGLGPRERGRVVLAARARRDADRARRRQRRARVPARAAALRGRLAARSSPAR